VPIASLDDIPSLEELLLADTGVFSDSGGATPSVAGAVGDFSAGAGVVLWEDQSGNDRHAVGRTGIVSMEGGFLRVDSNGKHYVTGNEDYNHYGCFDIAGNIGINSATAYTVFFVVTADLNGPVLVSAGPGGEARGQFVNNTQISPARFQRFNDISKNTGAGAQVVAYTYEEIVPSSGGYPGICKETLWVGSGAPVVRENKDTDSPGNAYSVLGWVGSLTGLAQSGGVYAIIASTELLSLSDINDVRALLATRFSATSSAFTAAAAFTPGKRTAFLGDSITEATGADDKGRDSFPASAMAAVNTTLGENIEWAKAGVYGQNAGVFPARYLAEIAPLKRPGDLSFLMIRGGHNDLHGGVSAADTYAALDSTRQLAQGDGWLVGIDYVICGDGTYTSEAGATAVNDLIEANAADWDLIFVSRAGILGPVSTPPTTYYSDPIHLNTLGYQTDGADMAPDIAAVFATPPPPITEVPTVTLSLVDGAIVVTRTNVTDASAYTLVRIESDGTETVVTTAMGLTYTETDDLDSLPSGYKVRGVNATGPGLYSSIASVGSGSGRGRRLMILGSGRNSGRRSGGLISF
jgi:lysophospholipase L1-like esterase